MAFNHANAALNVFYSAASSKLPVKNFQALITHYRTHRFPDGETMLHDEFLEDFDAAVKIAGAKSTEAMKRLAAATPQGKIPSTQALFKALSNSVASYSVGDFASDVGEGLKSATVAAAATATAGLGLYIAIGVGALLLPQLIPYLAGKVKLK